MGPPLLLAPDPPGVLKPGKLGLAGLRPDQIDGHPTSPCSYGAPCMDLLTVGNLVYCKIVAILFPRKKPSPASCQFSRSNQFPCDPKASIFCLFSCKNE